MMAGIREKGIRTCLWIHPYVPKDTSLYEEGKQAGYFVKTAEGEVSKVLEAFSGEDLCAVDFTNPEARIWWQSKLEALLDMGVAVFKTDFGEQAPIEAVYADGRTGLEMHNIYPLIYNRTAFELTKRKFGRGLVWGRAAYAGSQRYPVQWGGDSYSTLDQLTCQVKALQGYGLSGVPFCSHDVGGFDYSPHFFDDTYHVDMKASIDGSLKDTYPRDSEVYVRWMQVGVFSSHVRAHGKQDREPWMFGEEAEVICKKYLNLRYRLMPYIYSQAVIITKTALPMVRPMVLEFQEDPTTQRLDLQFMFVDSFLVAPVLTRHHEVQVYLPQGKWVNYWTKEVVNGNQWLTVSAPLDTLPLWIREGSIIPLGPEMDYVDQKALDPLMIEIYTPKSENHFLIEEEDQPSIGVSYVRKGSTLTVSVDPSPGQVNLVIYGTSIRSAVMDDVDLPLKSENNGFQVTFKNQSGSTVVFELD